MPQGSLYRKTAVPRLGRRLGPTATGGHSAPWMPTLWARAWLGADGGSGGVGALPLFLPTWDGAEEEEEGRYAFFGGMYLTWGNASPSFLLCSLYLSTLHCFVQPKEGKKSPPPHLCVCSPCGMLPLSMDDVRPPPAKRSSPKQKYSQSQCIGNCHFSDVPVALEGCVSVSVHVMYMCIWRAEEKD